MFNDFFNLIFPKLCCGCNNALLKNEKIICTNCVISLPKTGYHLDKDNPINKAFWGRVEIEMAASYYFFSKKSKVQNLLHHLKYRNNKEVGFVIGELYGHELKEAKHFKKIDFIIPVPLHPKKMKKRGYNQSEWIAKGLTSSMDASINLDVLYRKIDSKTQTKKSRYNRWENVGEIFGVKNPETIEGKNILLVDDVVTTGATLEGCAKVLAEHSCKIHIVTIACA
jgi:ComF family protein